MTMNALEPLPEVLAQRNYVDHFGFRMTTNPDGQKCVALPFQERNLGNSMIQALHGGVVALALETAGLLAWSQKGHVCLNTQIDIAHTTYLVRTRPKSLFAHAQIMRAGARFARLEARAFQDHGEVAHAVLTIALVAPENQMPKT